jgi:hypothetical protein
VLLSLESGNTEFGKARHRRCMALIRVNHQFERNDTRKVRVGVGEELGAEPPQLCKRRHIKGTAVQARARRERARKRKRFSKMER